MRSEVKMEEVIQLLKETGDPKETARQLGITRNSLYERLNRAGIFVGDVVRPETHYTKLDSEAAGVVQLLMQGKSMTYIGQMFNMPTYSVHEWMKKRHLLKREIETMSKEELMEKCLKLEKAKELHEKALAVKLAQIRDEDFHPYRKPREDLIAVRRKVVTDYPTLTDVQQAAQARGMSYAKFVSSPAYAEWRAAWKPKKKK